MAEEETGEHPDVSKYAEINVMPAPAFSRSTISHIYEFVSISPFRKSALTSRRQLQAFHDDGTRFGRWTGRSGVRTTQDDERMESQRAYHHHLRARRTSTGGSVCHDDQGIGEGSRLEARPGAIAQAVEIETGLDETGSHESFDRRRAAYRHQVSLIPSRRLGGTDSLDCSKKRAIPMVSYTFSNGAFRDMVIRFGYDPRTEYDARL